MHWEHNLYEYLKGLPDQSHYAFVTGTPGLNTAEYWTDWCRALFFAGASLSLWNEAPELKSAFLAACSLEEGMDVFLIGKAVEESGLEAAIRSILRNWGSLTVEEIEPRACLAIAGLRPEEAPPGGASAAAATPAPYPGAPRAPVATWDYDYLDEVPDATLDRLILFQAASHVADWERFAPEVDRVLARGGRLIIAEAPLGGREFREALHLDSHYESYVLRVLSGLGVCEDDLPDVGPAELTKVFRPYFTWVRSCSHQGMYLFYGQKGGFDRFGADLDVDEDAHHEPVTAFPTAHSWVRQFLEVKPTHPAWGLLSKEERKLFVPTIRDIETPHTAKRIAWGGGSLSWIWHNQGDVTDLMWSNLAVKPGDRVLLIGEFPEDLGTLAEVERRVGPSGEIVKAVLVSAPVPYGFADGYPEGYFDVVFVPQGIHNCDDWSRDAPRLLRALKPGGQVMAVECGTDRPEMAAARETSALVRLVGDRVSRLARPEWLSGRWTSHDVSTDQLREAFGDGLTDVCSLEHKGWVVFWGCKQ
ncbi:MAG: methyltransferase domain-containing protein [Thermoleophilia bacterium]|nr:methyltransferase domain-containing protein [Thermoleophilia bacterium]